jgi:ABC-2 type transport system ATP-binding protein
MQEYITIKNLTKQYAKTTAINDLDLTVHKGEIFGFLGPNGAGKTTTIRVLTTLTKPTSGTATVGGFDVLKAPEKVKEVIGVVQQHISLDRDLTVKENMEFHARLHRLDSSQRKKKISELLRYVELTDYANKMVDALSGGMKKKAAIVCSLLHEPSVLFLDEPTVGLDPQARRKLWDFIRRLNLDGTTIFLTTHYIEEAEALCGRVGIMHHGKLIALDTPAELRRKLGQITVEILDNKETRCKYFNDRAEATKYVQSLSSEAKTVIIRETNLEDVFVEQTGEKVGGV